MTLLAKSLMGDAAPEFSGIKGWLNSPPLTMVGLRGKVVFLDFWTYSCVNCIRSLPHMKALYERYSTSGLVLVGVHTPEFAFEKLPENVADAVKRFQIRYPVAIDSDNLTWKSYGNQFWPRQTIVDSFGNVRWEHAGEGDYDKMGEMVEKLLKELGVMVSRHSPDTKKEGPGKFGPFRRTPTSPEIYAGNLRSRGFGNGQVCVPGSCTRYIDQGAHERDVIYLNGDWTQFPEYVKHEGNPKGYAALKYAARIANAVLGTTDGKPTTVRVELDGKPPSDQQAGSDLKTDAHGRFLEVSENRLYEIISTGESQARELKLTTDSDKLCLYAYTFG